MKKLIAVLSLTYLLVVISPPSVYASKGLIKPNSRFYFLQTWGESLRLLFTFSQEEKINYLLELTERRVEEIKVASQENVANRYQNHFRQMGELIPQVQNSKEATQTIREKSLEQQQTLAQVYSQVSEAGQKVILDAQEGSSQQVIQTVEAVDGQETAQEYAEKVAVIQQAEKMGQAEQLEMAPMEESAHDDPSKSVPKELKSGQDTMPGQELKSQNQPLEIEGEEGGMMQLAEPADMAAPAGQN